VEKFRAKKFFTCAVCGRSAKKNQVKNIAVDTVIKISDKV